MEPNTVATRARARASMLCGHLSAASQQGQGVPQLDNGPVSCQLNSSRIESWGAVEGKEVHRITLINGSGLVARVSSFGAALTEMHVPDRMGNLTDVVHGYDNLQGYVNDDCFFGVTVGRVANRTEGGVFEIGGQKHCLPVNNGPNSLHGGIKGFNKRVWDVDTDFTNPKGPSVTFRYYSKDKEENYPGNLQATVRYTLTHVGGIVIYYSARTDKSCPVNLTNHSYFNLSGPSSESILDHTLQVAGDFYTPVNSVDIPTGEILTVKGTPFDFSRPTTIGERIDQLTSDGPGGYDHNYVLLKPGCGDPAVAQLACRVYEQKSGRVMEMYTTEAGMQLYSGNYLGGSKLNGKAGKPYKFRSAFCLEAQNFPNCANVGHFPKSLLRPGELYQQTTEYRFRVA